MVLAAPCMMAANEAHTVATGNRRYVYEDLATMPDDGQRREIVEGDLRESAVGVARHAARLRSRQTQGEAGGGRRVERSSGH